MWSAAALQPEKECETFREQRGNKAGWVTLLKWNAHLTPKSDMSPNREVRRRVRGAVCKERQGTAVLCQNPAMNIRLLACHYLCPGSLANEVNEVNGWTDC